jgi:hypothetical protein
MQHVSLSSINSMNLPNSKSSVKPSQNRRQRQKDKLMLPKGAPASQENQGTPASTNTNRIFFALKCSRGVVLLGLMAPFPLFITATRHAMYPRLIFKEPELMATMCWCIIRWATSQRPTKIRRSTCLHHSNTTVIITSVHSRSLFARHDQSAIQSLKHLRGLC